MYSLTLEINQKCNLLCKYCYLHDKNGTSMQNKVIKAAIDFGFQNANNHKDKSLHINFIGGEPLISFDLIRYAVEYSGLLSAQKQIQVRYLITSNALLLNDDIIMFFLEHHFDLKVSIDGDQITNDKNRIDRNGKGSYEDIVKSLHFIRKFEQVSGKIVQASLVITSNNYQDYFDSVYHIVNTLGFRFIDTGFDFFPDWTDDQINTIREQAEKIFYYYIEKYKSGNGFHWTLIQLGEKLLSDKHKFYTCGAGIVASYIRVDGEIFPCASNTSESVSLGNVTRDINYQRIRSLLKLESIENETCDSCHLNKQCHANSCIMQSLSKHGTINTPVYLLCQLNLIAEQMYRSHRGTLLEVFC